MRSWRDADARCRIGHALYANDGIHRVGLVSLCVVAGTRTGDSMELTIDADPEDCLEIECSTAGSHRLCRAGAVFSGAIVNRDSWQGDWSITGADDFGTMTISGPFRVDR